MIVDRNSRVFNNDEYAMVAQDQVQDQNQPPAPPNETTHWYEVSGGSCFSWFDFTGNGGENTVIIGPTAKL